MDETPQLHAAIVSLVALAANIAANHPKQGLCQVEKLRGLGVPQAHIDTVLEIARHIRDEAGQLLDLDFEEKAAAIPAAPDQSSPDPAKPRVPKGKPLAIPVAPAGEACCTPTANGQSCC